MNPAADNPQRVPAYCLGEVYRFEPWTEEGQEAVAVTVALAGGAYVSRGAGGELLVYAPDHSYGARLMTALALGLCHVVKHGAEAR